MSWRQKSVFDSQVVMTVIRPCVRCGLDTRFGHVDFQVPLHPGACTDAEWQDYDATMRRLEAEAYDRTEVIGEP